MVSRGIFSQSGWKSHLPFSHGPGLGNFYPDGGKNFLILFFSGTGVGNIFGMGSGGDFYPVGIQIPATFFAWAGMGNFDPEGSFV